MYCAPHMVCLNQYVDYDLDNIDLDWPNLVHNVRVVSEQELHLNRRVWAEMAKEYPDRQPLDEKTLRVMSMRDCPTLNAEVIQWLDNNVADVKTDVDRNGTTKAWAMGNEAYRVRAAVGELSLWFHRKKDAMAFIKQWSVHKKPTSYHNYFKDDLRKLVDGKLVAVERL